MLQNIIAAALVSGLPPAVELDFSGAATGLDYRINIVIRDAAGKTLVSGPLDIGDGADVRDLRDLIADVLGDSGLEITKTGDGKLRLASQGEVKLGSLTYDTLVKGIPGSLAGPKLVGRWGTASVKVNGAALRP